ncbi:MAG TPA: LLM class flavin-dependent oxidoreductase [Acidimicrobiia bacterium]|nr:LLM class flavin-dependent oxidoreductase [Acidimicrobiia bacterium]
MKVRIGVSLGIDGDTDPGALAETVAAMEELRFDSLWLAERITTTTPDPVAGLGYAAAITRRLKLGTGVMILPGRNPAVVAKQLATLDRLSGGRLLVTFGLGGEAGERAAFPITPGRRRGEIFDEALDQVRAHLGQTPPAGAGPGPAAVPAGDSLRVLPATVQRPLEFWVAGTAPEAQRRAGRRSDGWLTSLLTPDEARRGREVVEAEAERAGRRVDPEHFGVSLAYTEGDIPPGLSATIASRRPGIDPAGLVPSGLPATVALLEAYIAAGFSKFVVRPVAPPAHWPDTLATMAAALLPLQ